MFKTHLQPVGEQMLQIPDSRPFRLHCPGRSLAKVTSQAKKSSFKPKSSQLFPAQHKYEDLKGDLTSAPVLEAAAPGGNTEGGFVSEGETSGPRRKLAKQEGDEELQQLGLHLSGEVGELQKGCGF